jgi:hypothetical protein
VVRVMLRRRSMDEHEHLAFSSESFTLAVVRSLQIGIRSGHDCVYQANVIDKQYVKTVFVGNHNAALKVY